ncbi:Glycosyl hydrolases family 2, sugar binding domain [Micromonospora rhizosphaerae]|uniref:alpha-L-rhamnosidase n=1 Tax=Micromonospora rhizosphaerae TaxID=568872 RepID=A0A1C6SA42_9ACTN|nr:family 78 glycoside hydrolase catalytic domain [Micromonospora rhizosphaerae]SCL26350.1 Glycosyl hydrolases family 2, sugar binding domain [Micromonospora rhizosphaerae]
MALSRLRTPLRLALVTGLVAGLLPVAALPAAASPEDGPPSLVAIATTTDHLATPLGVDNPAPRLAWTLTATARGEIQTAAQVQVAASADDLGRGDLIWDSGRRETADQFLDWAGPGLRSATRYHWRVRAWGRAGVVSEWSRPTWFETGLLDAADWGASWIGAGARDGAVDWGSAGWIWHAPADLPTGAPAGTRYLRRSVPLAADATIRQATLIATADNHFRLFVNGRELGRGDDWQQVRRFDLTDVLRPGANAIAVEVTNDPDPGVSTGPAGFLGSLRVVLSTGATVAIRTNTNWRSAQTAPQGWTEPGFDDSGWARAQVVAAQGAGPWGPMAIPAVSTAAPQLRKALHLDKPVSRARVYYSGLGISELRINGERIGDEVLSPVFSRYDKRVYYVTKDVTGALRNGENVLGVTLGRGWYSMTTPTVWNFHTAPWRAEPALRLKLVVDHPDGTSDTVVSDGTWRWADSPTQADSLHLGEVYDARREQAGWDAPGFDDAAWRPVTTVPAPAGEVRAEPLQPIRRAGSVAPVKITRLPSGAYVFDFGEVVAGWARLAVEGEPGQQVELRYGEQLRPDGTVANEQQHITGDIQVDRYVLRGGAAESWEPRFSYKSFRYVEARGLPRAPQTGTLTAVYVHSDLASTSEFTSSNELFNRIHDAMVRTTLNNLYGYPSDSPMFEKNGWADFHLWSEDTLINLDSVPLVSKWVADLSESQMPDGRIPAIAPDDGWGAGIDAIEWGSAGVLVPWYVYQRSGDARIIARQYASMRAYVERKLADSPGLIADSVLGDWVSPGYLTPPEGARLTATAYLFRDLEVMRDSAALLGAAADRDRYTRLAGEVKAAFQRTFYDGERKVFRTERDAGFRQTSQILPLAFGLVPDQDRGAVTANLVQDITEARDDHLNTGSIGTRYLLPVLTEQGSGDVAFRVANQKTYPSWGYWFENGATTMWESWNLDARSRDHAFLGTIDQWFYEQLAGVRPTSPGYRTVDVAPHPVDDLRSASAKVGTPYGEVRSSWRRDGKRFTLDVQVPVGVTARVSVPASSAWAVTETGRIAAESPGVRPVSAADGRATFEVGSGSYRFGTDAFRGAVAAARDDIAAVGGDDAARAREPLEALLRGTTDALKALRDSQRRIDRMLADAAGADDHLRAARGSVDEALALLTDVHATTTVNGSGAVAGAAVSVRTVVRNDGSQPVRVGDSTLNLPDGWTARLIRRDAAPGQLDPGEQAVTTFEVRSPVDADTSLPTEVVATTPVALKDADFVLAARSAVTLAPPVRVEELRAAGVFGDAAGGKVRAALRNLGDVPLRVGAALAVPDGWRAAEVPTVTLAPGATTTVTIDVSRDQAAGQRSPELDLRLSYGTGALSRSISVPVGDLALNRPAAARVSLEAADWGTRLLTDGSRRSVDGARGYTSDPPRSSRDASEWVSVDLGRTLTAGTLALWPRTQTPSDGELPVDGVCFPEVFTVQVSTDNATWTDAATVTGQGNPGRHPVLVDLGGVPARYVRVLVTRLGRPTDFEERLNVFRFQLAELEVGAARPLDTATPTP